MFYILKIALDGNDQSLPVLQEDDQHRICLLNCCKHTIIQYMYIKHEACNFNSEFDISNSIEITIERKI